MERFLTGKVYYFYYKIYKPITYNYKIGVMWMTSQLLLLSSGGVTRLSSIKAVVALCILVADFGKTLLFLGSYFWGQDLPKHRLVLISLYHKSSWPSWFCFLSMGLQVCTVVSSWARCLFFHFKQRFIEQSKVGILEREIGMGCSELPGGAEHPWHCW